MSLNDPQWGRKGRSSGGGDNQGPPDLEELWRNFNQRLSGLFGRKSPENGGPGSGQPPSMGQMGGGIGLLAALIVIVWLASGFYTVDASQRAVVLTFGEYTETTSPGLRWRWPFPIQRHELVNLSQVRTVEVGYRNNVKTKVLRESLMLTDDENIVDIQFAVQYVLSDPEDYQFNTRQPDEAVQHVAEAAMREIVGKSSMDFVLYEGREQVAISAQSMMQDILDRYQTGVAISKVVLQNAQPPEQVQASFDDAVKAKQDLERQKNEGQAYYNDVVPKARGAASRLAEEAAGYRQRVIASAEGESSRFNQIVSEYAKAPVVTRERMYLDTMQEVLTNTSKVMVDARSQGNLLFLPLDKLMSMSSAELAAGGTTMKAPSVDAAPVPDTSGRSRDSLLNRGRDSRP